MNIKSGITIFVMSLAAVAVNAKKLNDTGVDLCIDTKNYKFIVECVDTGQDSDFGRDVNLNKPGDGWLGFSFQKICFNGEPAGVGLCPRNPKIGDKEISWSCTKDKVTGLTWEIKTRTGFRSYRNLYTNFGDGRFGDASEFVSQVNSVGLCGFNDWRIPSITELISIVNYGTAYPALDTRWFSTVSVEPNWVGWNTWSSNVESSDGTIWYLSTDSGLVWGSRSGDNLMSVRLVRGKNI